ncbi:MAG: DUF445 family protein [Syntrophomonadaceae bacterium]|nr:DUF445 family protein [Syntrophomonadaceae bacterium]
MLQTTGGVGAAQFVLIPVIGMLIGYITNVLAVRLLFWPREPVKMFAWELQGLLPRRQAQIAEQLGNLVEKELLLVDELFDRVNTPETQEMIVHTIVRSVQERLYEMLPRLVPAKVTKVILETIEKLLRNESPHIIDGVLRQGRDYLVNEVKVSHIVAEKINDYDLLELEVMIRGLAIKELTFIEVLGGVIGFIIGLIQLAILCWLPLL